MMDRFTRGQHEKQQEQIYNEEPILVNTLSHQIGRQSLSSWIAQNADIISSEDTEGLLFCASQTMDSRQDNLMTTPNLSYAEKVSLRNIIATQLTDIHDKISSIKNKDIVRAELEQNALRGGSRLL